MHWSHAATFRLDGNWTVLCPPVDIDLQWGGWRKTIPTEWQGHWFLSSLVTNTTWQKKTMFLSIRCPLFFQIKKKQIKNWLSHVMMIKKKSKREIYESTCFSLSGVKKIKIIHHCRHHLAAKPTNSREIKTELKYSSFKWIFFPIASGGRTALALLMKEAKLNWARVQHNVTVSPISCLNVLKEDKMAAGDSGWVPMKLW